jgi:hypothetical protein
VTNAVEVDRRLHPQEGMWAPFRAQWRTWIGKLANLAGVPCVVREGDYGSSATGMMVSVRSSDLYTTVTVNGVDVYFNRLSGRLDSIGFSAPTGGPGWNAPALLDRLLNDK